MQNVSTGASNGRNGWVYRVDKFTIPPAARDEFPDRVRRIHRLLETLPGFQDGAVLEQLEQIDSREHLKIVTLATWENRKAFNAARRLVQARYQEEASIRGSSSRGSESRPMSVYTSRLAGA